MVPLLNLLSFLLFGVVLVNSIAAYAKLVQRWRQQLPILEFTERRPVPWQFAHVFAVLAIYLIGQAITIVVVGPASEDRTKIFLVTGLFSLASCGLIVLFLKFAADATPRDRGESPWQWAHDVSDAAYVFGLFVIPTLAIQWVLSLFVEEQHPIIEVLTKQSSPVTFGAAALVAVIAAPIIEEYVFRVTIQGWLERVAYEQQNSKMTAAGNDGQVADSIRSVADDLATEVILPEAPSEPEFRHNFPETTLSSVAVIGNDPVPPIPPVRPSWGPMVISSGIFSLAHIGNAADPIPLFVFAMGLGWLYQRTHRVWPCILVHMFLNGFSMMQLAIYLASQA